MDTAELEERIVMNYPPFDEIAVPYRWVADVQREVDSLERMKLTAKLEDPDNFDGLTVRFMGVKITPCHWLKDGQIVLLGDGEVKGVIIYATSESTEDPG